MSEELKPDECREAFEKWCEKEEIHPESIAGGLHLRSWQAAWNTRSATTEERKLQEVREAVKNGETILDSYERIEKILEEGNG